MEIKKEIKKEEKIKEELSKITLRLEKAGILLKEISNIQPKIKKLCSAGLVKENLNKIIHMLILKDVFRIKFLKTGFRRLPRLLAEFDINVDIKLEQLTRQAESPETYGYRYPHMAVDPGGRWVVQTGDIDPHGKYHLEVFELHDEGVDFHQSVEFSIKGDFPTISSNNRVKGVTFNPDGTSLWVSAGTKPEYGPFKTWLLRFKTNDWTYEVFGPVFPYKYYKDFYSRAHFYNMNVIVLNGLEKIIIPVPSYPRTIAIFDPTKPEEFAPWLIETHVEGHPNFYIRFTDLIVKANWIYAAGWAENASSDGISNPRASMVIINKNTLALEYGPFYIPKMLGYYNHINGAVWGLRQRLNSDESGIFLLAEKLAPEMIGGIIPNHSGFAFINFKTHEVRVRDEYPRETSEYRLREVRDILEFGGIVYTLSFRRDRSYNVWHGLIRLDENLYPTNSIKSVPDDWWNRIYIEPHPLRQQDMILSAVRSIYHPNFPSSLVAIWKAF